MMHIAAEAITHSRKLEREIVVSATPASLQSRVSRRVAAVVGFDYEGVLWTEYCPIESYASKCLTVLLTSFVGTFCDFHVWVRVSGGRACNDDTISVTN